MAHRPRRRPPERGFSLIEVLVALAIFALVAVVFASSYLNILNSYAAASRGLAEDPDLTFCRNQLLQINDLATAEAGLQFDTPDVPPNDITRHVTWTADIEPTNTTDVFTVALTVTVTGGGGQARTMVDNFTLLRPTWSDPTDRTQLRQAAQTRIAQLQGKMTQ